MLLTQWGFAFDVVPSPVDEPATSSQRGSPEDVAMALSKFKAENVFQIRSRATVLAADTVVALDGKLYGKPNDASDARRILSDLMHHPHDVITGVTLIDGRTGKREIASETSRITMTPMSPEQLDAYIDSGLWKGKAGAYGVQDHDDEFVRKLEGNFSNVVGLPKGLVVSMLATCEINPTERA